MSFFDFIKKQFIDIIQWTEDGDGTLAWRFPMQDMEIQNGGQLVVRESQMAVSPTSKTGTRPAGEKRATWCLKLAACSFNGSS